MRPEDLPRVKEIFLQACRLDPAAQIAFLNSECGGSGALRAEVESLLARDRQPCELFDGPLPGESLVRARLDSLMGSPAAPSSAVAAPEETLPGSIGPYRIVRRLGEGGMGVVYEAEQANPRRAVALKVIRRGLGSPAVLRRFRLEAEVLGRLEHPGIARIYEAGAADDGTPYFAMEIIAGLPLIEHARERRLAARERLELMARICDAVHHAHQRGFIHRDLKPGNILVDASGQPKILDFGVARAVDAGLEAATLQASLGQVLGTVAYMSPEQAAGGSRVDVRADVYSLGVMIHELLAGSLPLHAEGKPLPEALRAICEDEPRRLGTLKSSLAGDVETIVLKALEKSRDRRYQSAAELGEDLRRHLRHEPISARPATALYQLGKFARRNKALVIGAALAASALVAGSIVALWQAATAIEERRLSEVRLELALEETYRAGLAAAGASLQAGDPVGAAERLRTAEESKRGWEWRHLRAQVDGSLGLVRPREQPIAAAFAPDDRSVVTVSGSGRLERWDPARGELLSELQLECEALGPAALSEGGGVLIAALGPERRRLGSWETAGGRKLGEVGGLEGPCLLIAMEQDGACTFGCRDSEKAWRWHPGRPEEGITLLPRSLRQTRAIAYSRGDLQLALAAGWGWVDVWDRSGAHRTTLVTSHREVNGLGFSPDGSLLAVAGDTAAIIEDLQTRHAVSTLAGHSGPLRDVKFSHDGKHLLTFADDGTVRWWGTARDDADWVLRGHQSPVYALALLGGSRCLVSGSLDGTLRFWDLSGGECLGTLRTNGQPVDCVAASFDGVYLATSHPPHPNGGLILRDSLTGAALASTHLHGARIRTVAFAPEGKLLASSSQDGSVRLWRVPGLDEAMKFQTQETELMGLAFSPDGARLAAGIGRTVRLWDLSTGRESMTLEGHSDRIHNVVFDARGTLVASASRDETVRIWSASTGEPRQVLRGHHGMVFAVAFSPDGRRLASAAKDGTIRLWQPDSGNEVAQLIGHGHSVNCLLFTQDGSALFSGGSDDAVRRWDTAPAWERRQARERLRAMRERLHPKVEQCLREAGTPALGAARLRADPALSDAEREAAIQELTALLLGGRAGSR